MSNRPEEIPFGAQVGGAIPGSVFLSLMDTVRGLRIYKDNTADASFERLSIGVDGNDFVVDSQKGATAGTARSVKVRVAGADNATIAATGATFSAVALPLALLAAATGETVTIGVNVEDITLATDAATTDSTANLIPANALVLPTLSKVLTTITTAANFKLGDATTADRFHGASTSVTAADKVVGLAHWSGAVSTAPTGPTQSAAAKARITCNTTPGAGKVRVVVPYITIG